MPSLAASQEESFNAETFATEYFKAWNNTQKPSATNKDLAHFLTFLTDDVAYQHLPYRESKGRKADGKEKLRKGMEKWLGTTSHYKATLTNTLYDHNLMVLQYVAHIGVVNLDDGSTKQITRYRTDVMELDNGKVSVIRKYGK